MSSSVGVANDKKTCTKFYIHYFLIAVHVSESRYGAVNTHTRYINVKSNQLARLFFITRPINLFPTHPYTTEDPKYSCTGSGSNKSIQLYLFNDSAIRYDRSKIIPFMFDLVLTIDWLIQYLLSQKLWSFEMNFRLEWYNSFSIIKGVRATMILHEWPT